ncbi:hypothetical protein GCM10027062_06310 [Nocardioides hungaricus]
MTLTMPIHETATTPPLTAVTYQRVSTKEQASKGGRDEGFSIPAQRQANARKAEDLEARIVAEFVDAGESARSADRPDLQRMLEYIETHQVTYCIVHKVDRLARNRLDDVEIHRRLVAAGVTLVSATENIDETPSGMLLHGIMSSIAEFYSKNLATEVTKGLVQKFETGGTPMRAPIGYLNVRKRDEQGREYRTVEIDPERAPLVRWVFEQYATGEHTVVSLLADVTARGLTTVPTPKRASGPVARSGFFKLLRNPYYIGMVRYKGAEQAGAHEPLIDIETWQQVQTLLDARKIAAERRRSHDHYLKGTLFCGACGSRMQLDFPANKQGVRYAYYVCSGRASKRKNCTRRAVPVGIAEQLVADCYRDITITEEQYAALAAQVEAAFDERLASRSQELAELTENRKRLQNESDKLLAAHFADAIDLDTLKRHQDRIRARLADIDRRLASEHDHHEGSRKQLSTALSLLVDCATLYARTDEQGKRLANQAFTDGIEISEDERATIRLAEPFAALAPVPTSTDVRCSSTSSIVELRGLEPLTLCMPCRCATSCATAPNSLLSLRDDNSRNTSQRRSRSEIGVVSDADRGTVRGELAPLGRSLARERQGSTVHRGSPQPQTSTTRLYADSRIGPSPEVSSSAQPQLSRPCSAARSVAGQPRRRGTASRIAAPCETATASSPGPIEASSSETAATMRVATAVAVSPPGTTSKSPRRNSSKPGVPTRSSWVSPCQPARSYSRSRASYVGSRPVSLARYAAVCRARAESLDHRAAGDSAASTDATAAAWR